MTLRPNALVVGAGFAGAVHARELAERGYAVDVIECRHHVAGNAFDEVRPDGTRVHRYGPHLFHTSNIEVMRWLERFGAFIPYTHHVAAEIVRPDGTLRHVPLPINRTTINEVFSLGLTTDADVADFLRTQAIPCEAPRSAADYLHSRIGKTLTDLFFRPYTRKMWALDLEDMHEAVVRRIPLRLDDDSRYFPSDRFQVLPRDGYAALVGCILDHAHVTVSLGQRYRRGMEKGYRVCFNSMPIDEFFDFAHGPLPYRSIRFHHRSESADYARGFAPVTNFTDAGIYTRETDWSHLPGHHDRAGGSKTVTLEEPCADRDNDMERYYPVRTGDDRYKRNYEAYRALTRTDPAMRFIGRCGTYQYLDMDQVINQSLVHVRDWLNTRQ
jgi:UDP-galactopyranose mutase